MSNLDRYTYKLLWAVEVRGWGCFGYPVQLLHPSRSLEPLPHVDWGNLEVRKNKFPRAGTCSRHVPTTMQVPHNCSSRRTAIASSRAGRIVANPSRLLVLLAQTFLLLLAHPYLKASLSLKNAPLKMLGHSLTTPSPVEWRLRIWFREIISGRDCERPGTYI